MANARTGKRVMRLTFVLLLLLTTVAKSPAEVTNAPTLAASDAAAAELFRAYLQVQSQLQATQLALERNRQEAEAAATRNAELLDTRLRLLEQALVGERARELDSLERSQHLLLIFAASFAGVGLLAILLSAYVQWRSTERLANLVTTLQPASALRQIGPPASGGTGALVPQGTTESASAHLAAVVERLKKRIYELEQTGHSAVSYPSSPSGVSSPPPLVGGQTSEDHAKAERTHNTSQIAVLLGKGQTLLDLNRAEEALVCFEEALRMDPRHPEALLKKGAALEQARKPDEAIACYDRAIATDHMFTMAYLQKGGLCNRLERYEEALKCYEEALRTQERAG